MLAILPFIQNLLTKSRKLYAVAKQFAVGNVAKARMAAERLVATYLPYAQEEIDCGLGTLLPFSTKR